ncbi:MAG TPA: hypothetical protein VK885_09455, partial [Desulfotignum sp.]|nr:hypothetical protein [Desulfotignum sp.]
KANFVIHQQHFYGLIHDIFSLDMICCNLRVLSDMKLANHMPQTDTEFHVCQEFEQKIGAGAVRGRSGLKFP